MMYKGYEINKINDRKYEVKDLWGKGWSGYFSRQRIAKGNVDNQTDLSRKEYRLEWHGRKREYALVDPKNPDSVIAYYDEDDLLNDVRLDLFNRDPEYRLTIEGKEV